MGYRKILMICILFCIVQLARSQRFSLIQDEARSSITITSGKRHIADFLYADTIPKPVLYPITAPNGKSLTRGYPLYPKDGEPTDHPHHMGMWFNYGDVNGIDFWNNSGDVPKDQMMHYGSVKLDRIVRVKGGKSGQLQYAARWQSTGGKEMIEEHTRYLFSEYEGMWVIDRETVLKALEPILFKDNKEGLLGLRVTRALQLPSVEQKTYVDAMGNKTVISAAASSVEQGNYVAANGKQGDDVWGTRAAWCMLYGPVGRDTMRVMIIDHPQNPGYPTYWHARGYGLFAANPLGVSVFTSGKDSMNLQLPVGEKITFRHRIVVAAGSGGITAATIDQLVASFAKVK